MVDRATFRRLNLFPTPVPPKAEEIADPAGNNRFNPNPLQQQLRVPYSTLRVVIDEISGFNNIS